MAGDTNSNIFINIDTSQAMTQLRLLEKELTALNRSLIVGTKAASAAQAKYAQSLLHNVNATGQWTASMTRMSTASEQFAERLDRQRLSLKEYFRYGMASTKTFGKFFGREFDTVGKLVDKRVKTLQQQYVQLGRDAQGAMNAMKFTPKALNYNDVTTRLMMATQRQQIFNKLVDDGAVKLLNFGKNTQWAGRQLMVGFTIPLMLFGAQAIKTFKEIETQTIRFKKVYGDIFTDQGATNAALKNIRDLADEYTKYGLKVSDTIKTAADAAAAGFSGKGLENLVEQTNKLAVLGGVTQEKALETTIALKNAFQIDTGAMAGTIDFLNAVENQTVVALDDLTEAIPKVAPVIQQLGGDVKDLAYFMAAMQEGGISAAQGANALKSGLASLINPSNAASKAAAAVGINIKGIVEANAGNLRNTVTSFAKALQPLTDLERSRVIEKVFGKYQFARISALLNNIGREGTQAARVLQLTNASVEELAILSQRELKIQADSPLNKFVGSVEKLKASLAPVGELFAKVLTPVIEFIGRMADKFNKLPDGIKKAVGVITIVLGGLGPLFLMTFGLLANAVANSVKGIQVLRKGYQQLSAGSSDAALKTQYLSQEELENISISNALYSKHQQLSAAYQLEATALSSLMSVYTRANASMGAFAAGNTGMFMPRGGMILPKRFATGTTSVPGPSGAGDVVPAMLSPGESVIPTKQTQKYSGFINQIIQDKVPGFMAGRVGTLSPGPAAFREAQQARYAARDAARRGLSPNVAPVISISSGLRRPGLSGIRFDEGADGLVTVTAGSQSFRVKKESVPELKSLLTENQTWLESKGRLPSGVVSAKKGYADTTEGKLEHVLRTRLAGKDILSPKVIFSKLQKYDASKVRAVPKELKSLRARYKNSPIYKQLVTTHKEEIENLQLIAKTKPNKYGLTEEELLTIQGAQGANAKEFKYSPALSHRFTDRQVSELQGLTQYKRNSPSNVFEEQSFLNKYFQDISKTSLGGMHISRRDQAQAALKMILDKPASKRSAIEKAVHATLDKRLATGYYEKFGAKTNQLSLLKDAGLTNAQIKELPRTGVPGFAGGVVSLGMPIAFSTVAKNRAMAQQIDARVMSSSFRHTPPTNFGVKLEEFTGHSFPIPGVGGVYRKPNGQVVVVKPVLDEKAALAEQRATAIVRGAHKGLDAPKQTIRTMIDPTDLTGKRKIIVLESPYNPKFATGGTKFSKKEYFTQLLASALRGDKDLSPSNVFGSNVADVGASGVFGKASGAREFNLKMPSLEEQAMINLLGVKGGARKAFAENTADIARSMTPAEYQKAMLAEINATIPRLEKTIASFGLTGIEKIIYQRMVDRLKAGRDVNWGKFQEVHSRVKAPLKLANGIVSVPGPKGAGDIQPAMLSPGEAVIPAKQSAKYMPLIQSMVADKVPGFMAGRILGGPGRGIPLSAGPAASPQTKTLFNPSGRLASNTLIKNLTQQQKKTYQKTLQILNTYVTDKEANLAIDNALKAGIPKELLGKALIKNWKDGAYNITSLKKYNYLTKSLATKESGTFFRGTGLSESSYYQKKLGTIPPEMSGEIYKILTILKGTEQRGALSKFIGKPFNMRTSSWTTNESIAEGFAKDTKLRTMNKKDVIPFKIKTSFKDKDVIPVNSMFKEIYTKKGVSESENMFGGNFVITGINSKGMTVKRISGFKDGVTSVPGPKGAGDVVPAMLSPGEAVIPAKQSAKYMPLIQSMVADRVPGFAESNIDFDGNGKLTHKPFGMSDSEWKTDPRNASRDLRTGTNTARTPDKVERAIDKVFNNKKLKSLGDRFENLSKKVKETTPTVAKLENTVNKTTQAFGKDKTRGFRGFLTGYGSVSQTVTNEDGTKRLATAAERTNMRQDNRMKNVQRMMPLQMVGMAVPMMAGAYAQKNPDSGIAKSMDLIMMVSVLVMLLPMLQSPLIMLSAIAIGLAAVFTLQSAAIKKNIIEGQNQAKSMSMTTEKLEQLGEITHKVSTTQTAQAKRDSRVTEIVPVSMDFGKNIITNSDFGKELKTSFEKTMNDLGRGPAIESLVSQLGTAVSQNVLTQEQAESIAVALTRNLKDASLELKVRGRLIQLFGPDGKNILNNPLQVQVDILTSGSSLQKTAMKNLQDVIAQERNKILGTGVSRGEAIQLGGGLLAGGATGAYLGSRAANAMSVASVADDAGRIGLAGKALNAVRAARVASVAGAAVGGAATAPVAGAGAIPGLIAAAVTGAFEIGIRQWQRGKEKAAIGKAAGLVSGLASENLKASQQSIDSINAQYASALENLRIKKQVAKTEADKAKVDEEILAMEGKRQGAQDKLKAMQANLLKNVETQYESVGGMRLTERLPGGSGRGGDRDKVMEAFKISMQEKFKGSALAGEATLLQSQLDRMKNDTATLQIQTLVTSDVLNPAEASALVSTLTATGKDISKTIDTIVRTQGTEGLDRLSTILTFLPNEDNRKNLLLKVSNMSGKDAAATYTALEELLKIPDYIGISIDMETDPDDIKELKKTGTEIERLKKLFPNGEISYTALIKAQKDEGGPDKNIALDKAIEQWGALSALPKNLQFQAMITMGAMDISDSINAGINRDLKTASMKDLGIAAKPGVGTGQTFVPDLASISDKQYQDWAAKNADKVKKITSDYWKKTLQDIFGIAPTDTYKGGKKTGSGDGATLDLSWANDLVQKLKLVKEGSLNALKPLESLQKFLGKGNAATKNPMLDNQLGKLKELEQQASKPGGVSLATNLVDLLKSFDPEQFALVYKYLFNIDGTLNDIGKTYNEAFKVETIGSYLQGQKEANKSLESQIQTFNKLTDAGYKTDQIIKILENDTLALDLANGGAFSEEELTQFNAELVKTLKLNQQIAQQKLGFAINDLEKQVDAYKKLSAAGVKQEVILEILKDKANVMAIANSPGLVADQYGTLITQTKKYLDVLTLIEKQTKTFEQTTQEAIDANVSALDLKARTLQNQFDLANIGLKAKIKTAEIDVKSVNDSIQKEQDEIDKINLTLKYDPNIGQNFLDDLQEKINDAQRSMDINFDRPLQVLSDRSAVLSNDLTLIDKATEAINEKYDAQEKALQTISQLNSDIAAQEKSRISLADALSQGDISAAAQLANDMRTSAAEAASRRSGDLLAAGRKAEIDNLVSASGMTKAQIEAEQFRISQQSYALEQQRKTLQVQILALEDQVYNITELREAKLLSIRDIETVIDGIKSTQLAKAQETLDKLQAELDKNQEILDAKLLAIENEKLAWDSVQLKLDAYKLALTNSRIELETMLDLINKIALAMATIPTTTATKSSAFVPTAADTGGASPEAQQEADMAAAAKAAADAAAALVAATAAALEAEEEVAKLVAEANKISTDLSAAKASLSPKAQTILKENAYIKSFSKPITSQYDPRIAGNAGFDPARVGMTAQNRSYGGMITRYMAYGGMIKIPTAEPAPPQRMSMGGIVSNFLNGGFAKGSDTVPAMLTPGEFVMNKAATKAFGPALSAINSSKYPSMLNSGLTSPTYQTAASNISAYSNVSNSTSVNNNSSSVYNYSVGINVGGSDASPQDIARAVMTQIKNVDSQRIRTQR